MNDWCTLAAHAVLFGLSVWILITQHRIKFEIRVWRNGNRGHTSKRRRR